jgi:hypothetical protein
MKSIVLSLPPCVSLVSMLTGDPTGYRASSRPHPGITTSGIFRPDNRRASARAPTAPESPRGDAPLKVPRSRNPDGGALPCCTHPTAAQLASGARRLPETPRRCSPANLSSRAERRICPSTSPSGSRSANFSIAWIAGRTHSRSSGGMALAPFGKSWRPGAERGDMIMAA